MTDNFAKLAAANLERLYAELPPDLANCLPAKQEGNTFTFNAFGDTCILSPDGIALGGRPVEGPLGILISLYALHANPNRARPLPLTAYKEFPNSMPYVGAFASHTEHVLVPYVAGIEETREAIINSFDGHAPPQGTPGDFSFVLYPLPKVPLCYVFYKADDDFPAAVSCLFSPDAITFLPLDALADVGEFTSRAILDIVNASGIGTS